MTEENRETASELRERLVRSINREIEDYAKMAEHIRLGAMDRIGLAEIRLPMKRFVLTLEEVLEAIETRRAEVNNDG